MEGYSDVFSEVFNSSHSEDGEGMSVDKKGETVYDHNC